MTIPPAPRRKKTYDEDLLVQLVAEGRMSYRKIAEQLGISPNTVSTIARGVFRPDLYARIRAAVEDAHVGILCRRDRVRHRHNGPRRRTEEEAQDLVPPRRVRRGKDN